MTQTDPRALLQTAVEAARLGGRVLIERYDRHREVDFKSADTDLVTDADRAAEAAIVGLLRQRHPDHDLLAEEGSRRDEAGRLRWVIDPLDGTVNYAHRIPHWCVSVAVEDASGPVAGVVFDPLRDELFAAARGQGATMNGRAISVTGTTDVGETMLATGFAYQRAQREQNFRLLGHLLLATRGLRRMGSAALDLAYVAAGRFDGFWELGLKRWDMAAGVLLVTEAGGAVSGFRDDENPLDTGRLVAGNETLRRAMVGLIAEAGAA